jgi:hypothetical protein
VASVSAIEALKVSLAHYLFGYGELAEVVKAATEVLATGIDHESVVTVASLSIEDEPPSRECLQTLANDVGIGELSQGRLAEWITEEISDEIAASRMDPVEGARLIRRQVASSVGEDGPWRDFAIFVDEWDESPEDRDSYRQRIELLARKMSTQGNR